MKIGAFQWLTAAPPVFHLPEENGNPLAITTADLSWVDEDGAMRTLLRGFPTDGCSFPRWMFRLDRWGRHLKKALPHDAGYALQDYAGFEWLGSKAQVDRRFLVGGIADADEHAMLHYRMVSAFGGSSWRRNNQPLIDAYVYACANGTNDDFIDWVRNRRKIIDLRAA